MNEKKFSKACYMVVLQRRLLLIDPAVEVSDTTKVC
jgi:hypothetical protein